MDRAPVTVRAVAAEDAEAIATIYNHYVTNTIVTFEEEPVAAAEIGRRVEAVRESSLPWLIAEQEGRVLGYAYATKWRERRSYRFSTEVTVYLGPGLEGRGIGSKLYGNLVADLRGRGIHAAMGGIALPNESSIALHEKFGFRKVAHFEQVGFKFNRWIDVGYWQIIL